MRFTTSLLRQTGAGLRVLILLTVLVGLVYPAVVWGVGRIGSSSAEGSPLIDARGCVVGSSLLGVDPQVPAGSPDPYFHSRVKGDSTAKDPTTAAMAPGDPANSGGSNLGPNSEALTTDIGIRRRVVAAREGVTPAQVPTDAVTGSFSGLDPQISPAYAALQIPRVARVSGRTVAAVTALVADNTAGRQLGFLGEERVNVPALNVALGLTAARCGTPSGG
ncbi:MAG: potassium-transporting ATPase subunit C [Mycobacteriaceae bacterium]